MNSNTAKIVKKINTALQSNSKRMIFRFTAVLLACVLGASLGGPIGKREATATPCVDHTLSYTHINSTLLESIRRICRAAKDLDKHINIECPDLPTFLPMTRQWIILMMYWSKYKHISQKGYLLSSNMDRTSIPVHAVL